MYLIDDTVITSDISEQFFVCDLNKKRAILVMELGEDVVSDLSYNITRKEAEMIRRFPSCIKTHEGKEVAFFRDVEVLIPRESDDVYIVRGNYPEGRMDYVVWDGAREIKSLRKLCKKDKLAKSVPSEHAEQGASRKKSARRNSRDSHTA